jgi:hypothetical protein
MDDLSSYPHLHLCKVLTSHASLEFPFLMPRSICDGSPRYMACSRDIGCGICMMMTTIVKYQTAPRIIRIRTWILVLIWSFRVSEQNDKSIARITRLVKSDMDKEKVCLSNHNSCVVDVSKTPGSSVQIAMGWCDANQRFNALCRCNP